MQKSDSGSPFSVRKEAGARPKDGSAVTRLTSHEAGRDRLTAELGSAGRLTNDRLGCIQTIECQMFGNAADFYFETFHLIVRLL